MFPTSYLPGRKLTFLSLAACHIDCIHSNEPCTINSWITQKCIASYICNCHVLMSYELLIQALLLQYHTQTGVQRRFANVAIN